MRKILAVFTGFTIVFYANFAFAEIISIPNPLKAESIQDVINTIINALFWLSIFIAPVMIIVGAFMFMTSAGEPKKVENAKKILLYTAIGVGVIMGSKFIVGAIEQLFNVKK